MASAMPILMHPTPLRCPVISHSNQSISASLPPIQSIENQENMMQHKMDHSNHDNNNIDMNDMSDMSDMNEMNEMNEMNDYGDLTIEMDSKMDSFEGHPDDDSSGEKSPSDEDGKESNGFRNELKRPDLKGTFRCSICQKVFCHSSSLSRHRMQAHFKSYRCTLCRKEITSNETLRAHMYKQHGISRMFMCRCCNWAFPDKTSLHMHIQAKEEGKNVSVPVIGKGLVPGSDMGPPSHLGHLGGSLGGPMGHPLNPSHLEGSAFASLHQPLNNNNLPHNIGMQGINGQVLPSPMPIFPAASGQLGQPNEDILARLRERFMLNSIMTQGGFGLAAAWMNQLPHKMEQPRDSSTSVVQLVPNTQEEVINVEKEVETPILNEQQPTVSTSENEEQKSEKREEKKSRSESPTGGSSTDGSSPAHTRVCPSPIDIFKKDSNSPSAFHPIKVEQPTVQYPDDVSLHVSPSDSHTTGSPGADHPVPIPSCYDCAVQRGRLGVLDARCRYLDNTNNHLQNELLRLRSSTVSNESISRALEAEGRMLREQNEMLRRKLAECQEQSILFLQSDHSSNPQSISLFLNSLIQSTIIR